VIGPLLAAVLAGAPAAPSYDALVAHAIASGRAHRLEEAGRTLDAAIAKDPSRPEAFRERGGLAFLDRRYDDAARDLRRALDLREDAYTRDLLATCLALDGRSDEALAVWNLMTRPTLGEVHLTGLTHTLDRVARREVAGAGEVVTLANVRETRLRLAEVGVFPAVDVRPRHLGEGRADLEVALAERHGFFDSPLALGVETATNLLYERVRPRFWNIKGQGLSLGGQYRWEQNRPDLSLQLDWPRPLGLGAFLRVSIFHGRQLYERGEPLWRQARGLEIRARRVLGARTVGQLALRASTRSFSRPDPEAPPGEVVGLEAGLDRKVLESSRHSLDAGGRLFHAGRGLGSDVSFTRVAVTLSYRAFLLPPEERLLERSVLAARATLGSASDLTPLDEMFAPGGSPEMELPLRAHPQTRDGALGQAPLARGLVLTNLEWRRRVYGSALVQAGFVVFLDGAFVSRTSGNGPRRFQDLGVGLRLGLGSASLIRLDYGHGLLDGANAFFVGLKQVF
jgi:tetratricopeptide (TPR) repeat protein